MTALLLPPVQRVELSCVCEKSCAQQPGLGIVWLEAEAAGHIPGYHRRLSKRRRTSAGEQEEKRGPRSLASRRVKGTGNAPRT